jgi:asparagine synthase (glutamine-hydrolysing)
VITSRAEVETRGTWLVSFRGTGARGVAPPTAVGAISRENGTGLVLEPGGSLPDRADGASCSVVFDGVLYDREELSEHFPPPPGPVTSDADLVLRAYLRWGEDALRKLKGIFALLIWDERRDVLLCARDPVGIYPLFYSEDHGSLSFSTSIQTLTRHRGIPSELNRVALADHLARRWPVPEETYFAAVHRVPPGHALRVSRGTRHVYRYWTPISPGGSPDWIGADQLEQFDEALCRAVNRCVRLGPVGIYLSGGFDSVSVASVAVDLARRQSLPVPWALSLVFPHVECNEEAVQRRVAAELDVPQVLMPLGEAVGPQGLLRSALQMAGTWPVPMLLPYRPAYHSLGAEGRRRGCQVIMTGGGGDEWLTVNSYHMADLMRSLDIVRIYRLFGTMLRSHRLPRLPLARFLLWNSGMRPLLRSYARRVSRSLAPGLLRAHVRRNAIRSTPEWVASDPALRLGIGRRAEQMADKSLREPLPSRSHGFYLHGSTDRLVNADWSMQLEEEFEAARRMGLRIVMPFWDPELVELLCRVPPDLLNRGGRDKWLVREAMARRFPRLGFDRHRKVGAQDFYKTVMLSEGPRAWKEMGGAPALAELGIVDGKKIEAVVAASLASSDLREIHRVWEVLSLEAWVRAHR